MDLGLRDKGAVVTGASKGIGRAIALGLATEGANIAICARGGEPGDLQLGLELEAARDPTSPWAGIAASA